MDICGNAALLPFHSIGERYKLFMLHAEISERQPWESENRPNHFSANRIKYYQQSVSNVLAQCVLTCHRRYNERQKHNNTDFPLCGTGLSQYSSLTLLFFFFCCFFYLPYIMHVSTSREIKNIAVECFPYEKISTRLYYVTMYTLANIEITQFQDKCVHYYNNETVWKVISRLPHYSFRRLIKHWFENRASVNQSIK